MSDVYKPAMRSGANKGSMSLTLLLSPMIKVSKLKRLQNCVIKTWLTAHLLTQIQQLQFTAYNLKCVHVTRSKGSRRCDTVFRARMWLWVSNMAGEVFTVDGEDEIVFEERETESGFHSITFNQPRPQASSLFTLAPAMAQPVEPGPAVSDAALQD